MKKQVLTQERLKELLYYNPRTGIIRNRTSRASRAQIRKVAGGLDGNGYISIWVDRKEYFAHRLAWLYIHGYCPENDIDHINGEPSDNRLCNLRHVSRQCNMRNRAIQKNNKSGVSGVCWRRVDKTWESKIKVSGKTIYIGVYKDFRDAVKARWGAEVKYEFPNCNTTSSAYEYLKEHNLI